MSRQRPRYKSRSSMYIRGLIRRNYTVLAEAVPIGYAPTSFKRYDIVRPSRGGGGYMFPCPPEINWLVPLFPQNRKIVFLCSLFPNIVFVPLFPSNFGIWSPEIYALFHLFPKTPGRASIVVFRRTRIYKACGIYRESIRFKNDAN